MVLGSIGVTASRLIAVSSPRRVRSQIARLGAVALPDGVTEKALMLKEAVSACAEGRAEICEELVCSIDFDVPPIERPSPSFFHPKPLHF